MFSALDWLIVAILVGGGIRGYLVGAVRQVASLVGLALAFLFSVEFMGRVGKMIVTSLDLSETLAPLAGFTVLFLGVYLLFLALSRLLEQVLQSLSLSVLNRVAGGAVGGFKAALLLSLLFLVLTGMELPGKETRQESTLYRPVATLLPKTIEATEQWFPAARKAADELGRRVRKEVDPTTSPASGSEAAMQEAPIRSGSPPDRYRLPPVIFQEGVKTTNPFHRSNLSTAFVRQVDGRSRKQHHDRSARHPRHRCRVRSGGVAGAESPPSEACR